MFVIEFEYKKEENGMFNFMFFVTVYARDSFVGHKLDIEHVCLRAIEVSRSFKGE